MGDKIIMSQKEVSRFSIVNKILEKQISQTQGAKLLNLSRRHLNRIIHNARTKPIHEVLIHKNRGKISNRKIGEKTEDEIVKFYESKYSDFGPTFFAEKLAEIHNIKLSKESVRKILIKNELWQTRKFKKNPCHVWRERKHHFGELIQFDGSHHRWLEERLDKEFCLLVFIDDATGEKFARFYEYEGTFPALDCLKRFVEKYGIPKAIYCDKHSTYLTTRQQNSDEQLNIEYPKTQFAKVVKNFEIDLIFAQSPQAKGRVERANSIFQDRLVKELRLANICTIDEANKFLENIFLPKINQKFNVLPQSDISLFKSLSSDINISQICSLSFERTICNDFTIHWQNRVFMLLNRTPNMKRKKIIIKQFLDGKLEFSTKNNICSVSEITQKFHENNSKILKNKFEILHIENLENYRKSKKSWMDKLYIGSSFNFSS